MNIIYISPNNYINPHLFTTYKKTFAEQGHTETINPKEATHCFIEVVSGAINYPDTLNIIKEINIPIVCFDNREFSVMGTGSWKPIDLDVSIYFVRTMIEGEVYPNNVFPYDWAYFNGCNFNPASKEELSSRHYDVCFIGVEAPTRRNVINGLLKDGRLKVKFQFNDHLTRLPHNKWIDEHREAKFYIEADGGGLASEKFLQLFSTAAMIKIRNKHLMAFPFTTLENCIVIRGCPSRVDIDIVLKILKEPDWVYDIYLNGINHMKEFYSEQAVSNYILKILK